jgi:RNA polymerase sigma-70 factor, ECF subfamily
MQTRAADEEPDTGMAQAPSEDQELLRQLAKGNKAAFDGFYERFQGPIFRFAWHMSGNQATAEEVTQEVFLRVIEGPRKYDPAKGSLAGYLFGIARNVMRQRINSFGPDVPLPDDLDQDSELAAESDLLAELNRQEQLDCLRKSVLALPTPYREALVLCDIEEMSYPDAAAVLQCPPGTVASRLHRARAMIKSRLKQLGCVR